MATQQNNTIRNRIEKAIQELVPSVTLERYTNSDDVRNIIRTFMRKHPEIFWFSQQYRYDEETGILRLKYNFTRENTDFFKVEIEKVIKNDFQIDYVRTLSELERLVYVYKWIVNRTIYHENSSFNQTIYSALINRNSGCNGYAKTAQYILALVGIESELVFGKFYSDKSENGRYCWNIVKINDKWYHTDFCLADKSLSYLLNPDESSKEGNDILWNYFCVSTDKILNNRSIELIETLPKCDDTLSDYPIMKLSLPAKLSNCCKSDFAPRAIPKFPSTSDQGVGCCPPPQCSLDTKCQLQKVTFGVNASEIIVKRSIWSKLFGKKEKSEIVNASAYAPAEITPYRYFIIRVFIHKPEESSSIDQTVKDVDKTAGKKANKPLDVPLKNRDKITIQFSVSDGVAIDEPIQEFIWRGRYIECDFVCELTKSHVHSVIGKAVVAINNVPCGDLKFTLDVVSTETNKVYAPVESRRYSKIFISYAHADYLQVRGIAEGCKMNGSDYFFDRHTLQAGDIFKDKILQYIDNADLFVLCWSKNAAESE